MRGMVRNTRKKMTSLLQIMTCSDISSSSKIRIPNFSRNKLADSKKIMTESTDSIKWLKEKPLVNP